MLFIYIIYVEFNFWMRSKVDWHVSNTTKKMDLFFFFSHFIPFAIELKMTKEAAAAAAAKQQRNEMVDFELMMDFYF